MFPFKRKAGTSFLKNKNNIKDMFFANTRTLPFLEKDKDPLNSPGKYKFALKKARPFSRNTHIK